MRAIVIGSGPAGVSTATALLARGRHVTMLDGGKVLAWLLGPKYQHVDDFLARYGFIILIVLVFALPQVLGYLFWPFFELGKWALAMVLV